MYLLSSQIKSSLLCSYALAKHPVPIDTEFSIADLFETLRPSLKRFSNFTEAEVSLPNCLIYNWCVCRVTK
jgi:hypothetical protein